MATYTTLTGATGTFLATVQAPTAGMEVTGASIQTGDQTLISNDVSMHTSLQNIVAQYELLDTHVASGSFSADSFTTTTPTAATSTKLDVTSCEVGDILVWTISLLGQQAPNNQQAISGVTIGADAAITVVATVGNFYTGQTVLVYGVGGVNINGYVTVMVGDAVTLNTTIDTTGGTYAAASGVVASAPPTNNGTVYPIVIATPGTTSYTGGTVYVSPSMTPTNNFGVPLTMCGSTLLGSGAGGTNTISVKGATNGGSSFPLTIGPWNITCFRFRKPMLDA